MRTTLLKCGLLVWMAGIAAGQQLGLDLTAAHGMEGVPFSKQFVPIGGTAPHAFSLLENVPAGFSISSSGLLAGTPANGGILEFRIKVTDSSNPPQTASGLFNLVVQAASGPLTIKTETLPNGSVGTPYTPVIQYSNGQPPMSFSVTGTLPPGVGLDHSDGEFGGSPTTPGTYNFTVQLQDSSSPKKNAQKSYSVVISAGLNILSCSFPDGTVTQPYNQPFTGLTGAGGTAPFSFAHVSGAMPPGLSINPTSGVLSGTPGQTGGYAFGVRVTDAAGLVATPQCFITIRASGPLQLSTNPGSLPVARVGEAIAPFTVVATGGVPPYTYNKMYALGWGSIHPTTGVVTGTPENAGTGGFQIEARDSVGNYGSFTFSMVTLDMDWVGNIDGYVGRAYENTVRGQGFPSGVTAFSIVGGALPPGLTLTIDGEGRGQIRGTPSLAGTFNFTVQASGGAAYAMTKAFSITILPAQQLTLSLGDGTKPFGYIGESYYDFYGAVGGVAPFTFTITAGSLPPGVALVPTGGVFGTPTTVGTYTYTMRAQDSSGLSGSKQYTVTIKNPLTLAPASVPNGTVGQPYSVTFSASGGTPPYFFYLEAGPSAGLIFDSDVGIPPKISGTPTVPGTFNLTVRAIDSVGVEGWGRWTYTIAGSNTLLLSPTTLPNGIQGVRYQETVFVGAISQSVNYPVTWTISNGALPPGIVTNTQLPDRIMFDGIPSATGTFPFKLTAKDASNQTVDWNYSITIAGQTIQISPATLPGGTASVPYSAQFSASGGTPPYTFEPLQTGGSEVSVGHWISPTGAMQGTAVASGVARFGLRATDSTGATGLRYYELTIAPASLTINPVILPPPAINVAYNQVLTATGGTAPYTYSMTSGALPAGMTLSPAGQISGAPIQAGNFTFGVKAQGANGEIGGREYSFFVAGTGISLGPASLPEATQGQAYSAQITASGGTPPYTFKVGGGLWDAGLQLSTAGAITGSPQSVGTLTPLIEATDAQGSVGSRAFQIVVKPSNTTALDIQPALLSAANIGQPYQAALTVTNGQAPYAFSLQGGALPQGIGLGADGKISGTPSVTGSFFLTVRVQDSQGAEGTRTLQITVNGAAITINPATLPGAVLGQAYNAAVTASGGAAPYSFAVSFGQLTHGLQLAANGTIAGTPSGTAGLIEIVIRATDANGSTGSRSYSIQVTDGSEPEPVSITTPSLPAARVNVYYRHLLAAAGGAGPYAWQVSSGPLPRGLVLGELGTLEGWPAEAGSFPFEVKVTERGGRSAIRGLNLTVMPPQEVNVLSANPVSLTFTQIQGTSGAPPQCVAVFSSLGAEVTVSGPPWLDLNAASLFTPGFLCVEPDAVGLAPGQHSGSIVLTSAATQPASVQIAVTLHVTANVSKPLEVGPLVLKGTAVQWSGPLYRTVILTNPGSEATGFTIGSGAAWVKAPAAGSVAGSSSQALEIELDPAGLLPGVYTTVLAVNGGETQAQIQVELVVSGEPGILALSQSAIELVSWSGGAPVAAQLGVLNMGSSALTPTLELSTAAGGQWLQGSLGSAPVTAGNSAELQIAADPAGLAPGRYAGTIRVRADEAGNGPQFASVGFTVLPTGTPLPNDAALAGVAFTPASPHGRIQIHVTPGGTLLFQTTISGSGGNWLTVLPSQGTVPANGLLTLNLTATHAGLSPGLYAVTLAVGFSDGVIRSIPIEFFVPAAGPLQARSAAVTDCQGSAPFVAHLLSPTPGFAVRSGRPLTVRMQAENCDGSPAAELTVSAQYSTQGMTLLPKGQGVWEGTWFAPTVTEAKPVQLSVAGYRSRGGVQASRQFSVNGQVLPNADADPAVRSVVGAANPAPNAPVAPGAWITIFGSNLAAQQQVAVGPELPVSLAGIEAMLGDRPLRLYYAGPEQVNGVVPGGVDAAATYQLSLRRAGVPAAPISVVVAEVAPGLFAMNQQGTGQAAALIAGTGTLASPASPVTRGGVVELYASGLGAVSNPPADGAPASLVTLSHAVAVPQVFIGGHEAQVVFAGLTPGAVGLYQVNVIVPENAPVGDAVSVRIVQRGVSSNSVTIAVR